MDGWRQVLNNYLQERGSLQSLSYDPPVQVGPGNRPQWQYTARYNNIQTGMGVATTKDAAKEAAAKQAMYSIDSQHYNWAANRFGL